MEDLSKYLTVAEVAKKLDVTEDWIRDLIQAKKLKAVKMRQWRIKPSDVDTFLKARWN